MVTRRCFLSSLVILGTLLPITGVRSVTMNSRQNTIIELKTGKCRFGQVGDWPDYNDIRSIDTGSDKYNLLIQIHELIESQLCKFRGITPEAVDLWDKHFKGEGEPGDALDCPYRKEHQFATIIEMMMAHELGINFPDYISVTNHIGELQNGKDEW